MNILVTGCNGQLGKEFQKISFMDTEHKWNFTDIDDLDICNKNSPHNCFVIHLLGN